MLDRPDQSIIWRELKKKKLFFFLSYFYGGKKKRSDIFRTWVELSNAVGAHVLNALEFFTCFYIYIKKTKLLLLSSFELYISNMCVLLCDSLIFKCVVFVFFFSHTNKFRRLFLRSPSSGESQGFTFVCSWLWESFLHLSSQYHIVVNTQLKNNEFNTTADIMNLNILGDMGKWTRRCPPCI